MTKPWVDVIVTHFNQQEWLPAAVASALDQDDVTTRVIVVDDASREPLPRLDGPADRLRVIRRRTRGGQGAATNTGIAAAGNDVVCLLDGDDLYPSYRVALLYEALMSADADLAYGSQVVFNDGSQPVLRLTAPQRAAIAPGTPGLLPGTTMFGRTLLERCGTFPENRLLGTFVEWFALARQSSPKPVEVAVTEPVLLRRAHDRNVSRTAGGFGDDYLSAIARARAGRPQ